MHTVPLTILLAILACPLVASPGDGRCAVCGKSLGALAWLVTDTVTGEKKDICEKCRYLPTVCYLCGMPASENYKQLADGRVLCARDVKSVVLDPAETERLCREVKAALDRQFSRFTSFPDAVSIRPADRVDLLELFQFPGNDFKCPNVWGYTQRQTNGNRLSFVISLLTGLPAPILRATAAHELAHAWIWEKVPLVRAQQIAPDAIEGFCELVSYLLMEAQQEESAKASILANTYTRGQARLFLEAARKFGFNEVVEWMSCGEDDRLTEADLGRFRRVTTSKPQAAALAAAPPAFAPVQYPDKLVLKNISGPPARRFAMINDKTFAPRELGTVHVGHSNLLIRCLEIRINSVVVQIEDTAEKQDLYLDHN
jgi:hypothetical protein